MNPKYVVVAFHVFREFHGSEVFGEDHSLEKRGQLLDVADGGAHRNSLNSL